MFNFDEVQLPLFLFCFLGLWYHMCYNFCDIRSFPNLFEGFVLSDVLDFKGNILL